MEKLLRRISAHLVNDDYYRNIKSIVVSENLFDDLSGDEHDWHTAHAFRSTCKPKDFRHPAIINRPIDLTTYINAIQYPFKHWNTSRFSNGSFGVWYGATSLNTTIYETVYHWIRWLRQTTFSSDFNDPSAVVSQRRVYLVACKGMLFNLKPHINDYPQLIDPNPENYDWTQQVGNYLQEHFCVGLFSQSARDPDGDITAIFNEKTLSNPRDNCYLRYCYDETNNTTVISRNNKVILNINNT